MEKLTRKTPDLTAENIGKIAELFPSCITETQDESGRLVKAINFEALRQILSPVVLEGSEAYEFTWVGKKAATAEAFAPISKTLRPCPEESVDWDVTQNLYIEGDNLDVLKLLQRSYLKKVSLIYIDPPYNTGNDFVYNDDFRMSEEEWKEENGGLSAKRRRRIPKAFSSGRFHSNWCSMIYARLLLARNLLTDDGAIFISIDDNEQDNLKKICDEVFGASNFVCMFVWNTKKAAQGMATAHMVVTNHEYILVYAKEISNFRFQGIDRDENNGFSNPDNDPRGVWKRQYLQRLGQGLPVRTITDPVTGNAFSFETPYTQDKLERWIQEGRIIFPSDPSKYPARKEFLSEYANKQQLITSLGLFATKATTEKLYSLFDGEKIFNNPKPDTLIKFLVGQVASDALILDFFSGSATTAHAVMQLNAEDGGNRRFIMVQIPEECNKNSKAYKAGYRTICEIGKERIRRAGAIIKESMAQSDSPPCSSAPTLDTGFRVFKTDDSAQTPLDLLFSCALEWGLPLSTSYQSEWVGKCTIYTYASASDRIDLIACFDKDIPESVLKHISEQKPLRVVFCNNAFKDSASMTNAETIIKTLSPDADIRVIRQ